MPNLIGRLDCSVKPGGKGFLRWHNSVANFLSVYPEFRRTSDRVQVPAEQLQHIRAHRSAHVWEYNHVFASHLTPTKGKLARSKKSLDYIKAFRK